MIAALNQLGTQLWNWLAPLSIELAALAALVLLASRLLPIKSPALRHLLWALVLLKPIVALAISSPWTVFTPLLPLAEPGWASLSKAISALRLEPLQAPGAAAPLLDAPKIVRLTPAGWLAALWLIGVALLVGRMLLGYGVVWHLRRRALVQHQGPLLDALQRARRALNLYPGVQVATFPAVGSPLVLGILRPLIVFPADLVEQLRSEELRLVLMHELAHVRRGDNFTLLLHRLVAAALFFHPVSWLCGRMLRREAEQACDDLVVGATGHPEAYARGLTNIAALAQRKTHAQLTRRLPIVNNFAAESDLALRIHRTLGGRTRRMGARARLLAAVALCALAAVTLPSSGVAQDRDSVDWETVKTTPPEEWTQELKDQITAAGYDIDTIAKRVRLGQEKQQQQGEKEAEARIWRAAMATDPDEWSDELKARILELKPDSTIEEIAAGIRQRQEHGLDKENKIKIELEEFGRRIRAAVAAGEITEEEAREKWAAVERRLAAVQAEGGAKLEEIARRTRAAVAAGEITEEEAREKLESLRRRQAGERNGGSDLEELGRRLRAAIQNGDMTPEEGRRIMTEARQRQSQSEGGDDPLAEFKRGVIARAMAAPPEEWSDELQAAIQRAGWDLAEFTEGIRQRQAIQAEKETSEGASRTQVEADAQANTAVEARSWGEVKEEASKND
ncbi:MAG: M48 family metalloprotease [Candidatus Latescibacteria bacterium]|nr:M48 family metalloprotease [Candidatus Latescibacterota bacterium]